MKSESPNQKQPLPRVWGFTKEETSSWPYQATDTMTPEEFAKVYADNATAVARAFTEWERRYR